MKLKNKYYAKAAYTPHGKKYSSNGVINQIRIFREKSSHHALR
jgi:hypothetical protein